MTRGTTRVLGAVAASAVLGMSGYAYTAANTVEATAAGAGSGAITGYTATDVAYTLNSTNAANIDAVAFTIAPITAGTVRTQLVAGGAFYPCSNAAGSVTCATTAPQATVGGASSLTVVAID